MKGFNFWDKTIVLCNTLAAVLLLLSYYLPFVPPNNFSVLSVLSLGVPLLIIVNFVFFIYWFFRLKRQLLLSLVVLLLGYTYVKSLYQFSDSEIQNVENDITIMTYNVRLFNFLKWSPSKTVKDDITNLITSEQPDILCLQEYRQGDPIALNGYFNFNAKYNKAVRSGQAIFSKFPIVNSGSLDFPNTFNNAIFVDLKINNDTIRVYSVHLQSSGINTELQALQKESSQNLFKRLGGTFKKQQTQAELLLKHKQNCTYKVIIAGDFNNTAYSYVYRKIKGDLQDTFQAAGKGFGRTYDFRFFPVRIDFILADNTFRVRDFKTYDEKFSDHYPIKTTIELH